MSSLSKQALGAPILSVAPIHLPAPGRGLDLALRVSTPVRNARHPVIVFSHGNGQSLRGYGPLVDRWAAEGFVVIQPTHLDARTLGLTETDPRRPDLWRHREEDLARVLDGLDSIEDALSMRRGQLDRTRIAVAGHSWGAQTAGTLLGATHPDPAGGSMVRRMDERVKAGVLLAPPGGGKSLTPQAAQRFPFLHPDFSAMTAPVLIVVGDRDHGDLSTRGPAWWRDAFDLSPSPKALFTAHGGEHSLGGIPGYESRETTDEKPERVAAIAALSSAFLRSALWPGDQAWPLAVAALEAEPAPEGRIETK